MKDVRFYVCPSELGNNKIDFFGEHHKNIENARLKVDRLKRLYSGEFKIVRIEIERVFD